MDMQRRVGALLVALTGLVVACGSEQSIGVTALPEGVFLAVVSPEADASAKASVESPLDVALQVDPRVIGTNCTIAVTVVVSDSTGETLNAMAKAVTARFDGVTFSVEAFRFACEAMPFLANGRVVTCRGVLAALGA